MTSEKLAVFAVRLIIFLWPANYFWSFWFCVFFLIIFYSSASFKAYEKWKVRQMSDISYSENCYFLHPSILICNDQTWLISNLHERGFFTAGVRAARSSIRIHYLHTTHQYNAIYFFVTLCVRWTQDSSFTYGFWTLWHTNTDILEHFT